MSEKLDRYTKAGILKTFLLIAFFAFVNYVTIINYYSISSKILIRVTCIVISLLLYWWLKHIQIQASIAKVGGMLIIILILPFYIESNSLPIDTFSLPVMNTMYLIGILFIGISLLRFIFSPRRTLFGCLLLLNLFLSIIIFLPFTFPIVNFFDNYHITFFSFKNYQPFLKYGDSTFHMFLDLRLAFFLVSIVLFLGYISAQSFILSCKAKKEDKDNFEQAILDTSSKFKQILLSFEYSLWQIYKRVILFGKQWGTILKEKLSNQIKRSSESYFDMALLVMVFLLPFLVHTMSTEVYNYLKYSSLYSFSIGNSLLYLYTILLITFPIVIIYLNKLILTKNKQSSKVDDSNIFHVFSPPFVILTAAGFASISSIIFSKTVGYYTLIFSIASTIAVILGFKYDKITWRPANLDTAVDSDKKKLEQLELMSKGDLRQLPVEKLEDYLKVLDIKIKEEGKIREGIQGKNRDIFSIGRLLHRLVYRNKKQGIK